MKNNLKLHLWISHILLGIGVILAIAGVSLRQEGEGVHFLLWIALGLGVVSVVYKALTIKCPHCGGFLPAKYKLPQTCPTCGKPIFEEVTSHEETHP